MFRAILIPIALLMGGCGGEGLAAFLGAAGSLGASYTLDTVQTDARDVAEFNAKHNMRVDRVVQRCFSRADAVEEWAEAKLIYVECFEFEENNQPAIFVERLRNRVRRVKEKSK